MHGEQLISRLLRNRTIRAERQDKCVSTGHLPSSLEELQRRLGEADIRGQRKSGPCQRF